MPIGPVPEPVILGGPRPRPTAASVYADVDDPPSLTEAIRARRAR
jgi:hypothetical protein